MQHIEVCNTKKYNHVACRQVTYIASNKLVTMQQLSSKVLNQTKINARVELSCAERVL
jgi:hypothetical protein